MKPVIVTWDDILFDCVNLAKMIDTRLQERDDRWEQLELLGVARGGAVVAVILSNIFESRYRIKTLVNTIGIKRYHDLDAPDAHPDNEAEMYSSPPAAQMIPTFTVVVDEVCLSGKTLQCVLDHLAGRQDLRCQDLLTTAVLYSAECSAADICLHPLAKDEWVYFPWEVRPDGGLLECER